MSDNPIKIAFAEWGKSQGLRKKSSRWYADGSDVIAVVDLQKSQYSMAYYINVAFWIKSFDEGEVTPLEHHCHIRTRIEKLIDAGALLKALDLDTPLSIDERAAQLDQLLGMLGSRLEGLLSIDGIIEAMHGGWNPVVAASARELIAARARE